MKRKLLQQAEEYRIRSHRRRTWQKIVGALACIVVFCVTYALILPAITMENATCDLEEHSHVIECYTQVTSESQEKLVCTGESLGLHVHTESCYGEDDSIQCGYADFVVHTHNSYCYDEDGKLVCLLPEIKEHIHTDNCYAQTQAEGTEGTETRELAEPELICTEPQIELHTHTTECYDKNNVLICGKLEVLEHIHTENCIQMVEVPVDTNTLTCELEENESHQHTAICYGTWKLNCQIPEHKHTEECQPTSSLTEEERTRVDAVIAMIDRLPTSDEIEAKLTEYDTAGDESGYEDYYKEISMNARTTYAYYEDMGSELQAQVTNADKLLQLEWLWSAVTFGIKDSETVYQINNYSQAVTTLVSGGSIRDKLGSGMAYTYWDVIVVEKNGSGQLYISQYVTDDVDKRDYAATTTDGFVLLLYNTSVNASIGDIVTVSFDYSGTGAYDENGYGTISFGSTAQFKPDKDNSGKLDIVTGANTRELIEVNLYDYGTNINDLYNSNIDYPGFQQDNGTVSAFSSLNGNSFNFGNNITSDLSAGKTNVTVKGGTNINATANTYNGTDYGLANIPISGAMKSTLGADGYPALSDDTSLSYLFSNSDYATKKNSQNIDGLFQYNQTTGAYTFNSRENHAQFNAGSDTFTLYRQILSSNFMMYPFGNFLPFNDIVKESMQTSDIDRAYLKAIADSAQYKQDTGRSTYIVPKTNATEPNEYGCLADKLNQFISLMDAKYGENWVAADAMNEYFKVSGISKVFTQNEQLLQNLYSIDYDEPTDFYFGMEMKMNFMQPKNGMTGPKGDQGMVFYFTGDDDVWVYVDDKLFLDLSGIHRHVGGEIDFVNGTVSYYSLDVATGDVNTTPYKTVTFADILGSSEDLNENGTFKDYTTHSFNFYYMERGAGSGVCRMNFNFPLLRQNAISITKELSTDADITGLLGNPDFRFQVLRANNTQDITQDPFIGEGVTYHIYDEAGNEIGTGITGVSGVFTLKAGQTAVFSGIDENAGYYYVRELMDKDAFAQYGKVTVDGNSTTTDSYTDVTIGSDIFKGVLSPVKNVSDGNTAFTFNNQIETHKLGSLTITKNLTAYHPTESTASQFEFIVTLDGKPLPKGTEYTVTEAGGTERTENVIITGEGDTKQSLVIIGPSETASIDKILAGTPFTVQETAASGKNYMVTYAGSEGVTTDGNSASGIIKVDTAVGVNVTNAEKGTAVTIPGNKTLTNPDGTTHTYNFLLQQVVSKTDMTPVTNGIQQTTTAVIDSESNGTAAFSFTLSYVQAQMDKLPATFYYSIIEQVDEANASTQYDSTVYLAEVRVEQNAETDELQAELIDLWKKDGETLIEAETTASFTNTLLTSLTLAKETRGDIPSDTLFNFTVTLTEAEGKPLTGNFSVQKNIADGSIDSSLTNLTFDETGTATIQLRADESILIRGIPYGAIWTASENAPGYQVSFRFNGEEQEGTSVSDIANMGNNKIVFVNSTSYILPETGGTGTFLYTLAGLTLLCGAAYLLYIQRKHGKEEKE